MSTSHEERHLLLAAAKELHLLLQEVAPKVRQIVSSLIGAADELALVAADEVSAGTQVMKKVVTYRGTTMAAPIPIRTVTLPEARKLAKGKKACSLCRQPGHWAKNCPNAHIIQQQKKDAVAARPVKKERKPMSPERKAQLVATLAKARAARGKKGK